MDIADDQRSRSTILAGNIASGERFLDFSSEDECDDYEDWNSTSSLHTGSSETDISLEDLKQADKIFEECFGFHTILSSMIRLLLSGDILPTDILCQALAYTVQIHINGKHSVRYLESYGLFWAGVRNLIKTRGLIPFREHMPIPSNIGKSKEKIIQICNLDKMSLGKSGLQKSNLLHWINGKKFESNNRKLAISLTADAKKIASSPSGREDLGGLGNRSSASDEELEFKKKSSILLNMLDHLDDRKNCFELYNNLTSETFELVTKLSRIEDLLKKNLKGAEKNSNLLKYVHVLKQQRENGRGLIIILHELQRDLIEEISILRSCNDCIPDRKRNLVNLSSQPNYRQLDINVNNEAYISDKISSLLKESKNVLSFPWHKVADCLKTAETIGRSSGLLQLVYECCYLRDSMVYEACGLSQRRPLGDMKQAYMQSRLKKSNLPAITPSDQLITATIVSNFAPMTFGKNRILKDGGIFVRNGICALPDLLVFDTINSKVSNTYSYFSTN